MLLIGFAPNISNLLAVERDIWWHYPHNSKDAPHMFSLNQRIDLEVTMSQDAPQQDIATVVCDITRWDWDGFKHIEEEGLSLSPTDEGRKNWTRYYVLSKEGEWEFVFTITDVAGNSFTRDGWGKVGEDGGGISMYDVLKIIGGALVVIGLITKR